MLDYWKLYISDRSQIEKILNNEKIEKAYIHTEDGEWKGTKGKYKNWGIRTLLSGRLEITGSIHRYWNGGTNENDFNFLQVIQAIRLFCKDLQLDPFLAKVINLEFGVNLQLSINASEIINQIVCFNYRGPRDPYENRPDYYFIEFAAAEYYLKIYDKGKQYQKQLPQTPNTLRFEVKAMNSRFLNKIGIETLSDLLQPAKLQVLGLKFNKLLNGLVFEDDTINPKRLSKRDRRLYEKMINPRKMKLYRGNTNSTIRNHINRFKRIVEINGKRNMYSYIFNSVKDKIAQLSQMEELADSLPNSYSLNNGNKRLCLSCGKDISHQHKRSIYCSAKYVGYREAHKCRNDRSNPRNNLKSKIARLERKGPYLFDQIPLIVPKGKKRA